MIIITTATETAVKHRTRHCSCDNTKLKNNEISVKVCKIHELIFFDKGTKSTDMDDKEWDKFTNCPEYYFVKKKAERILQVVLQDHRFLIKIIKEVVIKPTTYDENDEIFSYYTARELYDTRKALDRTLSKLETFKSQLEKIFRYQQIDGSRYYDLIKESIQSGNTKLQALELMPTNDTLSNEKGFTFTGNEGSVWYDAPLLAFLDEWRGKFVVDPLTSEDYKINSAKSILRFLTRNMAKADELGTRSGTIQKTVLIEFIQRLLILEKIASQEYHKMSPKDRIMRSEKTNMTVYRIHHDFQMSLDTMAEIIHRMNLLSDSASQLLMRSSKHFFKHEHIPAWILKSWREMEIGDESIGESMKW